MTQPQEQPDKIWDKYFYQGKKHFAPGLCSNSKGQEKNKPEWQRLVTKSWSQTFKLGTGHIFNCNRWLVIVQTRKVAAFLSCIFRNIVLLLHWDHILPYRTHTQILLRVVSKGLTYGFKKTEMVPEFPVLQCDTCWQSLSILADFSGALSKDRVCLCSSRCMTANLNVIKKA